MAGNNDLTFDDLIPQGAPPPSLVLTDKGRAAAAQQAATNLSFDDLVPHSTWGVARTGAIQGVGDVIGLPDAAGRAFLALSDKMNPGAAEWRAKMRANPTVAAGTGSRFAYARRAIDQQPEWTATPSVSQQVEDFAFQYLPRDDARTNAEKVLQMATRGLTAGALTGPLGAEGLANAGRGVLTGAITGATGSAGSELAGQATAGTKFEPYARVAAGILAGGGTNYLLNRMTTTDSLINSALRDYTKEDFTAAQQLMDAANAKGINLTPAEALAQVKGGNTPLMNMQRYAENAPKSAPVMQAYLGPRGMQNDAAVNGMLETISPVTQQPANTAAGLQKAAQNELDQIRQSVNRQAAPYYEQAASQSDQLAGLGVNPYVGNGWEQVTSDPAFRIALQQVRSDPLNVGMAQLPDHDLQVLDAVKKQMDLTANRAISPGVGAAPDNVTAAAYTAGKNKLVNMMDQQFPDYATARAIGAEGRQGQLANADRSIIGQMARTDELTQQQNLLMPKNISDARPQDVQEAVKTLVRQGVPDQAAEAIRLKLQDIYQNSLANVKGTQEQFRGAQFANNLTRYSNQIKSLEGAIRALPDGDKTWGNVSFMLDVLKAQGQRMPVGSATEFNRLLTDAAQRTSAIFMPLRGLRALTNFGNDALNSMALRGAQGQLGDILTDPTGALRLYNITQKPAIGLLQQGENAALTAQRLRR